VANAKGVEKVIEEKDTQLDLVRKLELNNTGLQGEIRAKNKIVKDLIANRHVPRRHPIDNILCFVDKKCDDEEHKFYVIRCQRKDLEKSRDV